MPAARARSHRAPPDAPSVKVGGFRLGTLNVRSLLGRMSEVLDLAQRMSLDVLCLQEIRLSQDNLLSAQHAAKQAGWKWITGSCAVDRQGAPTAGVGPRGPCQMECRTQSFCHRSGD